MPAELLLEIGTEEIPAGYLEAGLKDFKRLVETTLAENRISVKGSIDAYGTPRRLTVVSEAVLEKQEDLIQEITGPPRNIAYDEDGNPTKAAFGFAQKQGISVDEIGFIKTPKGEYLFVKKEIEGRSTKEILAENLPKIVSGISWPKSMRWGSLNFSFTRPIHWVLALFDGEIIPFEVAGVISGDRTRGHRFMSPKEMTVSGIKDYFEKMKAAYVVVDQKERERLVFEVVIKESEKVGGVSSEDQELVGTVANLTEYPTAVCGSYDRDFLSLPSAVLITAMREHQKYFAVYKRNNELMPNFIAVNNTLAKDPAVVRRGHERVLRARLSDARFFFNEDRKRPLEKRLEDLKGVIYQADLGTSYEKVKRFTSLAGYLCERIGSDEAARVDLTSKLCKCDLVTLMVSEFPSLQGIMGMEYAREEGYPDEVAMAIYEHYLPAKSGGPVPESEAGAIVGCADRMDTIVGCFAVGLEPTGSADPFAVRRHALAVLRIIEEKGWSLSLSEFINKSIAILAEKIRFKNGDVLKRVLEFFRERYRQQMLRKDYHPDFIEAVISVRFDNIKQVNPCIEQLKRFASESGEFNALAQTFKRVTNILKNQEKTFGVKESLFRDKCEADLWRTYQELKTGIQAHLDNYAFFEALTLLARLRKPVDDFFDSVEILTRENENLRNNRVGLLQHLAGLFLNVADLSKISI